MALELIGKTAPLPGELRRAADDGFKKIELYMREEFLTDRHLKFLSDAKRDLGMEFYSIHTPHSKPAVFLNVLKKTKDFARKAGIPLIVVHSEFTDVFSEKVIKSLEKNTFPENGYDHSILFLEKMFKRGVKICFDVAHFYVATISMGRNYYDDLDKLFSKHSKNIAHVHFADATEGFAGKKPPISNTDTYDTNIGDGEIDFFQVVPIIKKHYNGVAVVETDTDRQLKDLEKLQKVMSATPRRKSVSRISRRPRRA